MQACLLQSYTESWTPQNNQQPGTWDVACLEVPPGPAASLAAEGRQPQPLC